MASRKEKVILDLYLKPELGGLGRASAGTVVLVKEIDRPAGCGCSPTPP